MNEQLKWRFNICIVSNAIEVVFRVVKSNKHSTVADLLEQLNTTHGDMIGRDPSLYKPENLPCLPVDSCPTRVMEWLSTGPKEAELRLVFPLDMAFPTGSHMMKDCKVDILVVTSDVLESLTTGITPTTVIGRRGALQDREDTLMCHRQSTNPVDDIQSPEAVANVCDGERGTIRIGRPYMNCGPSPALFNSALAHFHYRINHVSSLEVLEPSHELLESAHEYIIFSNYLHDPKINREAYLEELFYKIFDVWGSWRTASDIMTCKSDGRWGDPGYVFYAGKNEKGLGGDPMLQAAITYGKAISGPQCKDLIARSHFPAILIGTAANQLEISIAIFTDAVYVEKLLVMDLALGAHQSTNVERLARIFQALKLATRDLRSYYQNIDKQPLGRAPYLPAPTPASGEGKIPAPEYLCKLSDAGEPVFVMKGVEHRRRAIYIANMVVNGVTNETDTATTGSSYAAVNNASTNIEVVVKFTARYNEHAHRLLAKHGLAPKLHACCRVLGDLYMVVMERFAGERAWDVIECTEKIPAAVARDMEKALALLHAEDLVFGDLRSQNVLYSESDDRAVLVDFDWVGRHGVDRYPATLNSELVGAEFAPGMRRCGLMEKDHDIWMLQKMVN